MPTYQKILAARFLDVIEDDIVPRARTGVSAGNKVFGAAILRKDVGARGRRSR